MNKINKNMTELKYLGKALLNVLFPEKCPLCGEILSKENRSSNRHICMACHGKINYYDNGTGARSLSLLKHDEAAKKIIYNLKFNNKRDNAAFLADEVVSEFGDKIKALNPDVIVPVPLHKKRLRERGFNQAELIGRKIAEKLSLPFESSLLIRQKKTIPQMKLNPFERKKNLENAFSADGTKYYETVLLIDDIYTTGSTVEECRKALLRQSAGRVFYLTMSRV